MLLSTVTIALESTTRLLEPVRQQLATVLGPLFLLAELPYLAGGGLKEMVATREALVADNRAQAEELLRLAAVAQQYQALRAENERLRALLGSRARLTSDVLIAELAGVLPDPDTRQIMLDKGTVDGVVVGAPVIDAYGLFGRVVEAGRYMSRVLLVTDVNHAVPVQVNRSGVRSIAGGTGDATVLELENVSITADITVGDLVETSGLGGGFPVGYPVGRVRAVRIEPTSAFAIVEVTPMAELDRSRHLLILLDPPADPLQAAESSGQSSDGAGTQTATAAVDPAPDSRVDQPGPADRPGPADQPRPADQSGPVSQPATVVQP